MKLFIYLTIFLVFSSVVFGAGGGDDNLLTNIGGYIGIAPYNYCSTAKFCGEYELTCEAYGDDNKCPENYGDWSSCVINNYGGKCNPCDPNCGECGDGLNIKVPNVQAYSGSGINIEVNAYGNYNGEHVFFLYKTIFDENGNIQDYDYVTSEEVDCNGGCLNIIFENVEVPSGFPCEIYTFKVEGWSANGNYIGDVQDTGMVSPYIHIINPTENIDFQGNVEIIQGNIEITSQVECPNANLIVVVYQLCQEQGCTRLITLRSDSVENFNYNWNTATHVNGSYRLDGIIVAPKQGEVGMYTDSVNVNLNNEELEADISGTYQGSKILNIILARIKTWI